MSYDLFAQALKSPAELSRQLSRQLDHDAYADTLDELPTYMVFGETAPEPSFFAPSTEFGIAATEAGKLILFSGESRQDPSPFPSLLACAPWQLLLDRQAADASHPLSLAHLTGRTPKQYLNMLARAPGSPMTRFRKALRRLGKPLGAEDTLLVTSFLGRFSHRQQILASYLKGENAYVIEHDILRHWCKVAGVALPGAETLNVEGVELGAERLAERVRENERYRRLLLPVLSAVQTITPEQEATPDAFTWATFNAWWAVASLIGVPRLISDFRLLWPRGHDLLVYAAEVSHMDYRFRSMMGQLPFVATKRMGDLQELHALGDWLSSYDNLLGNWALAGERLTSAFKTWESLCEQRWDYWQEAQRSLLESAYFPGPPGDVVAAEHLPDSILTGISQSIQRLKGDATHERLAPIEQALAGIQQRLDLMFERLRNGKGMIMVGNPDGDKLLEKAIDKSQLASPALVKWLRNANQLNHRLRTQLDEWQTRMATLTDGQSLSLADQMARIQACQQDYAKWLEARIRELGELFRHDDKTLDWEQVVFIDLSDAEPQQAATDTPQPSDVPDSANPPDPDIHALKVQLEAQADELARERERTRSLQHHLDQVEKVGASADDNARRLGRLLTSLDEYARYNTASNALNLAEQAYPDRLRILACARDSARDADSQLSGNGLLRKLLALATEGWDVLQSGRPSYDLNAVVPGEVALNESQSISEDPRLRQQRRFTEKAPAGQQDRTWEMHWHIRLDHRHRLYFAWDADTRQIVIGHAGAHLSIATAN